MCACVRAVEVAYRVPGAPTADWVDIYNRLYRERIIFLGQEIDDELANQIIGVLLVRATSVCSFAFAVGAGGRGQRVGGWRKGSSYVVGRGFRWAYIRSWRQTMRVHVFGTARAASLLSSLVPCGWARLVSPPPRGERAKRSGAAPG